MSLSSGERNHAECTHILPKKNKQQQQQQRVAVRKKKRAGKKIWFSLGEPTKEVSLFKMCFFVCVYVKFTRYRYVILLLSFTKMNALELIVQF